MKEISINYNGDIYIIKSKYDYDLYEAKLNRDKEIEKLNNKLDFKETNIKGLENNIEVLEEVIKKYENIIKEVREIFKYYGAKEDIVGYSNYTIMGEELLKLLEILDKVEENTNGKD